MVGGCDGDGLEMWVMQDATVAIWSWSWSWSLIDWLISMRTMWSMQES